MLYGQDLAEQGIDSTLTMYLEKIKAFGTLLRACSASLRPNICRRRQLQRRDKLGKGILQAENISIVYDTASLRAKHKAENSPCTASSQSQ